MTQQQWFWIFYVGFALVCCFLSWWPDGLNRQNSRYFALVVAFFILMGLVGNHDFGSAVK